MCLSLADHLFPRLLIVVQWGMYIRYCIEMPYRARGNLRGVCSNRTNEAFLGLKMETHMSGVCIVSFESQISIIHSMLDWDRSNKFMVRIKKRSIKPDSRSPLTLFNGISPRDVLPRSKEQTSMDGIGGREWTIHPHAVLPHGIASIFAHCWINGDELQGYHQAPETWGWNFAFQISSIPH